MRVSSESTFVIIVWKLSVRFKRTDIGTSEAGYIFEIKRDAAASRMGRSDPRFPGGIL